MKTDQRCWLPNRRYLWYGGLAVAGICVVALVAFCLVQRRGPTEQEIVAKLLSKDPNAFIDVDGRPTWANSVREILGIPKPVTSVFLHGAQITDADLASLGGLSHLQLLTLEQCAITDEGVKEIAMLRTLEALTLGACPITDASLAHLGSLKSLASLNLYAPGKPISGCNIRCLSALPKLAILTLADCDEISDDVVEALASLKHLLNLDIRRTSISDEGARRLAIALPETLIIADTQEPLPVPKGWGKWGRKNQD